METEEILEDIQEQIAALVAGGFATEAEIAEEVTEVLQEDYERDDLHAEVEALVAKEIERHRILQSDWIEMTDCDRLETAFSKLNKEGIVARENFSCCGTCGSAEIDDEAGADTATGYVFYHMQDTESAVQGCGLCFNYGSFTENENEYDVRSIEIGHRVVAALKEAGLSPKWSGDLAKRIELPLEWKKRRI